MIQPPLRLKSAPSKASPLSVSVLAVSLLGCTANGSTNDRPMALPADQPMMSAVIPSAARSAAPSASAPFAPVKAEAHPAITFDEAVALLYPQGSSETTTCKGKASNEAIHCLIGLAYHDDAKGLTSALSFYDELGAIAGVEREQVMEGGFRGDIHIVPERPIGPYQKHFDWTLEAQREIKTVFDGVESRATKPMGYFYRPIGWKFMRSVGRTTPSAYAEGWRVGYNVSGSLNTSMVGVRDTLVHEIFHLNDEEHGNWSRRVLGNLFDGIVTRCGTKLACLSPYAPMKTTVRGGTYYAFQPDNGDAVHEYAAELASRYFLETRVVLRGEKISEKAFKCGPSENDESWRAIVDEFFGGVDLIPACSQ